MLAQATVTQEKHSTTTPRFTQESSTSGTATLVDNRPATVYQGKLQEAMTVQRASTVPHTPRRTPQGSARFQQIATAMGDRYGVDTSGLKATHNSSFPGSVNAVATIQGANIHFTPGRDTHYNIKHEVARAIDNKLQGTPKGEHVVNSQRVDTTREKVVDRMAKTPIIQQRTSPGARKPLLGYGADVMGEREQGRSKRHQNASPTNMQREQSYPHVIQRVTKTIPVTLSNGAQGEQTKVTYDDSQKIGSGVEANIYKGNLCDKAVAVKVAKEASIGAVTAEIEAYQTLGHDSAITTMKAYNASKGILVLELMAGSFLDSEVLPTDRLQRLELIKPLWERIKTFHKNGRTHGDLALRNFLIDDQKKPKLADFVNFLDFKNDIVISFTNPELQKLVDNEVISLDQATVTKFFVLESAADRRAFLAAIIRLISPNPDSNAKLSDAKNKLLQQCPANAKARLEILMNHQPLTRQNIDDIITLLPAALIHADHPE